MNDFENHPHFINLHCSYDPNFVRIVYDISAKPFSNTSYNSLGGRRDYEELKVVDISVLVSSICNTIRVVRAVAIMMAVSFADSVGVPAVFCVDDFLDGFLVAFFVVEFSEEFELHIGVGGEAGAGANELSESLELLHEGVAHGGAVGDGGRFEETAEEREDGMEGFEAAVGSFVGVLDATAQLGDDRQVDYERSGEERILACVVDDHCLQTPHKDTASIFVHRSLAVSHEWNVFDYDHVIGILAVWVEQLVALHHVVHYRRLGDLLRSVIILVRYFMPKVFHRQYIFGIENVIGRFDGHTSRNFRR